MVYLHAWKLVVAREYSMHDEGNTPNQKTDNISGFEDGDAASGPFMWEMVKDMVLCVGDAREEGVEVGDLRLPDGAPGYYGETWSSVETRGKMRVLVAMESARLVEGGGV